MAIRFEKTALGHQEIRERSHGLSRTSRMMLVLADGQRTGEELLALVKGSTAADVALLLEQGLIDAVTSFGPGGDARAEFDTVQALRQFGLEAADDLNGFEAPREVAATGLSYTELYDSLNALAKEQLGLFKGYRFSLEIERANGIDEMRAMAQRFVLEVRKAKGEAAAQMVRRALGLRD